MTPNEIDLRKAARQFVLDQWTDGYTHDDILEAIQEAIDYNKEVWQPYPEDTDWFSEAQDSAEGGES